MPPVCPPRRNHFSAVVPPAISPVFTKYHQCLRMLGSCYHHEGMGTAPSGDATLMNFPVYGFCSHRKTLVGARAAGCLGLRTAGVADRRYHHSQHLPQLPRLLLLRAQYNGSFVFPFNLSALVSSRFMATFRLHPVQNKSAGHSQGPVPMALRAPSVESG